jgi:uncharacterized protein
VRYSNATAMPRDVALRCVAMLATLLFALLFSMQACAAMSEADPAKVFSDPKNATLAKAVADGDEARIEAAIKAGGDPNARGDRDATMLEWALLQQSPRGMKALLDHGADASRAGTAGATVLHMAAMANDVAYLRILLDHGVDPNAPHATTGAPPIDAALKNPEHAAFDLLLAHRADPNRVDRLGNAPLHVAAKVHDAYAVMKLLEAGADASAKNQRGDSFQVYFNIAPAGGFSGDAKKQRDAVDAWLVAHGVALEAKR